MTMRPNVTAMPACVIAPLLTSLMTIAPVPAKTSAAVPKSSARKTRRIVLVRGVANARDILAPDGHPGGDGVAHVARLLELFRVDAVELRGIGKTPVQA